MQCVTDACTVCARTCAASNTVLHSLQLPAVMAGALLVMAGQLDAVTAQQFPGLMAVYTSASTTSGAAPKASAPVSSSSKAKPTGAGLQPRMWAVFDATAVLPEYLVSWQHAATPTTLLGPCDSPAGEVGCKDPLVRFCAAPLAGWLNTKGQQPDAQAAGLCQLQERCAAATAEMQCPARPQLPHLSAASLVQACEGKQVRRITWPPQSRA